MAPPPLTNPGLTRRLGGGTTSAMDDGTLVGGGCGGGGAPLVALRSDEGVGNMLVPTRGVRPVPVE